MDDRNNVFDTEFNSIGNRSIIFLTDANTNKIYKDFGKRIKHLAVKPAQVNGDIIQIRFIPYFKVNPNTKLWGKRKKGEFLSFEDWITVQFKMDHLKEEFQFFKIKKPVASFPDNPSNK